MRDVLREILESKRAEVVAARAATPIMQLKAMPLYREPRRFFSVPIMAPCPRRPHLIAEIKHRSPSAGVIRPDFDPVQIARTYAAAGAAALSVLTDEKFFGGRLEHLAAVRRAVELPLLRKDFIVDEYQLYEARAYGADAVLLIAEALETTGDLFALFSAAIDIELHVLIEVNSEQTLGLVLDTIHPIHRAGMLLGINNRNLAAQTVDLATTERLAKLVPPDLPIVAESGIKSRADVERMRCAGARALLVGETLLREADPAAAIRRLFD